MKKLVVYDSLYGNTEKVARAIAKGISANAVAVKDAQLSEIQDVEMLVVGSPTHGGRPTEKIQKFLEEIPPNELKQAQIAVFDTRIAGEDLNFALKLLVRTIGYAAPKMGDAVTKKGGQLAATPEGFIVKGKEGPLADGELARAEKWLKK